MSLYPRPSPFRPRIDPEESHPRIQRIRADDLRSVCPDVSRQGSWKDLWARPGYQNSIDRQTDVIVQATGIVFLNDKDTPVAVSARSACWIRRFGELSLDWIIFEWHSNYSSVCQQLPVAAFGCSTWATSLTTPEATFFPIPEPRVRPRAAHLPLLWIAYYDVSRIDVHQLSKMFLGIACLAVSHAVKPLRLQRCAPVPWCLGRCAAQATRECLRNQGDARIESSRRA